MKKEEIISISAGDVKKFYSCAHLATEKYEDGKIIQKGKIPDGKVTEYYSSILCSKTYKNGKLHGVLQILDAQNGVTLLEEEYANGILVSAPSSGNAPPQEKAGHTFVRLHDERVFFSDGKETGRQSLDEYGKVISEKGEMFNGEAKEFYPDGGLKRDAVFVNGQPHGQVKTYDNYGRVIAIENYDNGYKEGTCVYFSFAKGVLTEEKTDYAKGRLNGKRLVYGLGGKLVSTENFKNERLEGVKETFHLNGILESRCTYKNNIRDGSRLFFYDNGKTMYEEYYIEGKLNGNRTGFFPDGKIYLEEKYKDGKLDGRKALYNQEGQLISEEFYENGQIKK